MAEQIKIAELNIDVSKVVKSSQEYLKSINALKEAQKQLRASGQESSQQFVENDANLKNLNKSYRDSQKLAASLLVVNKDFEQTLSAENKSNLELLDSRRQLQEISKSIIGNSDEEIALRDKLNNAIDAQTEAMRDQSSEFISSKDKVGEYSQAIDEAIPRNSLLGQAIGGVKDALNVVRPIYDAYAGTIKDSVSGILNAAQGTEGLTKAQKAQAIITNVLTNGLRLFKVALAATGIGLILVALGSLVTFLSSTQEGVDKVNSVLKPMQVIFSRLFGVIQNVGKALFEAFSNPKKLIQDIGDSIKKNLEVRFEAVIRIFNRIKNFDFKGIGEDLLQAGTGVENLGEKTANFFNKAKGFIQESIDLGQKLAKLQIDIENNENAAIVRVAELNRLIKEQNKIAEDTSLSQQEREKATIRTIEASKEILSIEQGILDKKIEQKEIENSFNDTSREDQKELNELIASRIEKETQALELQTTQTNKLNTIRREIATNREREAKEALELTRKASEEAIDALKVELEIYKETNIEKLAADGKLNKARIEAALAAESFIKDESLRITDERLKAGLVKEDEARLERLQSENAYNERKKELEQEFFDQQEELRLEREEKTKERQDAELEAENELRLLKAEDEYAFREIQLEQRRVQEVAAAEKIGADTKAIESRYALLKTNLERKVQESKLSMYSDAFGQLEGLVGKQTTLAKTSGIAQATINTYLGASKALADYSYPLGPIFAGLTIAQGLAQVAAISGVKFAKGGILLGPSHAQGGIKTPYGELEGNEIVLTKGVTQNPRLRSMASQLNVAGGGRSFAAGGVLPSEASYLQNRYAGGGSMGGSDMGIDYDLFAAKVAQANSALPPQVLDIRDFYAVDKRVQTVEQRANV
tara:strand:+ start:7950 stop:10592 length:2643 start_codon:yes stop_codon:yes gene_type:complete